MADTTIAWTNKVWNPVRGCRHVSVGCSNCYAERFAHRFAKPGQQYHGLLQPGYVRWNGRARFVPEMLEDPFHWRKPARVFVNSMSDLFHEDITDDQIAAVFGVMATCQRHTFQVLTKRPGRMVDWFRWVSSGHEEADLAVQRHAYKLLGDKLPLHKIKGTHLAYPWPLPNVWLGVSCENQAAADERIPLLLQCSAEVHWVSLEPLLGPINLTPWLQCGGMSPCLDASGYEMSPGVEPVSLLDWVVAGGESGCGARLCDVEWLRSIVRQCEEADVPLFVKQLGALHLEGGFTLRDRTSADVPDKWPSDLRVRQYPEGRT